MRRLSIFLYFLVMITASFHLGDFFGSFFLLVLFLFFHNWAEELDEAENDNF